MFGEAFFFFGSLLKRLFFVVSTSPRKPIYFFPRSSIEPSIFFFFFYWAFFLLDYKMFSLFWRSPCKEIRKRLQNASKTEKLTWIVPSRDGLNRSCPQWIPPPGAAPLSLEIAARERRGRRKDLAENLPVKAGPKERSLPLLKVFQTPSVKNCNLSSWYNSNCTAISFCVRSFTPGANRIEPASFADS